MAAGQDRETEFWLDSGLSRIASKRARRTRGNVITTHTVKWKVNTMASMTSMTMSAKLGCNVRGLNKKAATAPKAVARTVKAAAASGEVPDMGKRNVMNLLLVGAIGLPATSLVGGYAYFFVPPR